MKSRYLFIYSLKSFFRFQKKLVCKKKYVNSPDFKTWPTHTYVTMCFLLLRAVMLFFSSPKKMLNTHFFPKKNTPAGRWRMKFTYKLKLKYLSSSVMFLSEVDFWKIRFFESLFFGSVFFGVEAINESTWHEYKGIQCHPPYFRNFSSKISLEQLVCYSCPSRKGPLMLGVLGVCKDLQKIMTDSEIRIHRQRVIGFNVDTKTWNFMMRLWKWVSFILNCLKG